MMFIKQSAVNYIRCKIRDVSWNCGIDLNLHKNLHKTRKSKQYDENSIVIIKLSAEMEN
jgi:hypothetical protein